MADERKKNPYAVNGDELYRKYYSDAAPGAATGTPTLADMYQKITARPAFQYDAAADPLYQQSRDRYIQNARMAMRDTQGQAASLTGGYGSSYGQAVGQQAYDRTMTGLTDMIPELYQTAYDRYQDEGNNLMQQYSMLKGQDDAAYNRYRDAMSDARYQQQLDYQQERDAITDARYQQETAYSRQQDAYKNLYSMILSYGYTPTAQELAAAGMTDAVAKTLLSDYARRNPAPVAAPAESGGGGGGGGGYRSGGGSGNGNGTPLSFTSQRELDAYLRQQVSAGNITKREATDLRDEFSSRIGSTSKKATGGTSNR